MFKQLSSTMYLEKPTDVDFKKIDDSQYMSAYTIGKCKPFLESHEISRAYMVPLRAYNELYIFLSLIEDGAYIESEIKRIVPNYTYTGHCTIEILKTSLDSEEESCDEECNEIMLDDFIKKDILDFLDKVINHNDTPIIYRYNDICAAFAFVEKLPKELYYELQIFKYDKQFFISILCDYVGRECVELYASEYLGELTNTCYSFLEEHAEEIISLHS